MAKVGDASQAFVFLQKRGTIIRPVGGLPEHIRITVGTAAQNDRFLAGLQAYLNAKQ